MKYLALITIATLLVAGCSSDKGSTETTVSSPNPTAQTNAPAASLGSEQKGTRYQLTLKTVPAEPKVGSVAFEASLKENGGPATVKTVHVDTSMPEMGMSGPSLDLRMEKAGVYKGTADLSMGGAYEAKVHVAGSEGSADDFTYKFDVSQ